MNTPYVEKSTLTTLLRNLGVLEITKDYPKNIPVGEMNKNANGDPKKDASKSLTTKQTKKAKATNENQPYVINLDCGEFIEFYRMPWLHNNAQTIFPVPNELSHLLIKP